jgi:TonB family protein
VCHTLRRGKITVPLVRFFLPLALTLVGSAQSPSIDDQVSPKTTPAKIGSPSVSGLFVNPVPDAPFTATVQILSHQKLSDGSTSTLKLVNRIARDSKGRTDGESRHFVATSFEGDPPVDAIHIYDPTTLIETHLDPYLMVAWQTSLKEPLKPREGTVPADQPPGAHPPAATEDLGIQTLDGLVLRGIRQSQGAIVNEFWYSADLSMYLIRKHIDGDWELTFTATQIVRGEPDPSRFAVPPAYRLVDGAPASWRSNALGVYRVGGGVSPPTVVHSVDPQYTDQARAAKLSGICILGLVVGTDGVPQDIKVTRSLGMGLDEEAIKAVSQYRFNPAMYQGHAVPVQVTIEVNFQQYQSKSH